MTIRSATDTDKNLFVVVDEMWDGTVRLAYKSKFEDEARSLVSVLPIYLDFKIGNQIWVWFTEDTRKLQQSYEYTDEGLQAKPGQEVFLDDVDFEFMEDIQVETGQSNKIKNIITYKYEMAAQKGSNPNNDHGTIVSGAFGSVGSQDTTKVSSVTTSPFLDSFSPELQKKFEQNNPKLMEYIAKFKTASPSS